MRAIVVGAGGTTRAVLERLGERWDVVVIDTDADLLARAATARSVATIHGDGSSVVVLEQAGYADADAVIAATGDDRRSLEVCRLARDAGVERIVAVASDPELLPEFRRLEVPTVSPDRLAARTVEINLEPRRVASAAFANGRAEALEFRISPDSPLRGRALKELGLQAWLVAAVLRRDQLIVPNGNTVLEADDLVTVVGATADHGAMVAAFTGGQTHFPLEYGRDIAVWIGTAADLATLGREAAAMVRATAAEELVVCHPPAPPGSALAAGLDAFVADHPGVKLQEADDAALGLDALVGLAGAASIGVLVLPKPRGRLATVRTLAAVRRSGSAALLVAGTFPYRTVVAPARDSIGGWNATWTAIDLAARTETALEALGVVPPEFIAGADEAATAKRAVTRIRDEASVHGVSVSGRVETGNPVRVFRDLPPDSLLVLGLGDRQPSIIRPGITALIVSGARTSVVVVPDRRAR